MVTELDFPVPDRPVRWIRFTFGSARVGIDARQPTEPRYQYSRTER